MEGGSSDCASVESQARKSSISSGSRVHASLGRKEFFRKFMDSEMLTDKLQDWFLDMSEKTAREQSVFDIPFDLTELQKFDYALEGVTFQQLIRMPSAVYASTSDSIEADAYLAIEDFLHASLKGLWDTFWGENVPMPFSVACLCGTDGDSRFYPAEKAVMRGKLEGLCATAIMLRSNHHSRWEDILELALLRPDVSTHLIRCDGSPSLPLLGQALFFALRMLLARSLGRASHIHGSSFVFVLLVDSQCGGVVKVEGDINKMKLDVSHVYDCAAEWIRKHAQISVSPVARIWNQLGNANWGDVGVLQTLLATFQSIEYFCGCPKHSIEDLASDHATRLQNRRSERQLEETKVNGNGFFLFQQRSRSPEIIEVQEESMKIRCEKSLKLEIGSMLWLEDMDIKKCFQINEVLSNGSYSVYVATLAEESGRPLFLYVGSSPSQFEPAWEDMSIWYQVQRQTKVLNVMKQRGITSKYLPQLVASGRIIHPGHCQKSSSSGTCDHPWCGTPILGTYPVGESVADMVRSGRFNSDAAMRCFHDCLSALAAAAPAGIRHSDIRPENVICAGKGMLSSCHYVLIGWGHAILEDRDRPTMNLLYSSSYALQEGRLCSASDAESLIYLIYFSCGGALPDLDSVEAALSWRVSLWSRRVIQQKLGEISAVLKAFADYVDSLCGTPYPMDYGIWLRRVRMIINDGYGKDVDLSR